MLLENQTRSILITEDTQSWDMNLVRTIFTEEVAEQVLSKYQSVAMAMTIFLPGHTKGLDATRSSQVTTSQDLSSLMTSVARGVVACHQVRKVIQNFGRNSGWLKLLGK
jgi:hypothetical protein